MLSAALIAATIAAGTARAEDATTSPPEAIEITDGLPYGQSPVDYTGPRTDDAAARLNRRLESGEASLARASDSGYLAALLTALDVPVESQLLVFSKTALNPNRVGPRSPRAIYFNDDVSVGFVPGAEALEIMAVDPNKGPMFYVLPQGEDGPPRLRREERCLACHAGTTTIKVPGFLVRSFVTDDAGNPEAGWSRVTHDLPLEKRCGGWFVTGTHGTMTHCGNVFGTDLIERFRLDPTIRGNATDLSPFVDLARYPSRHSDLVAHLVLHHQAHGTNLITRVNYESRLGRRSDAEEQLVRYLLFADEPPLTAPIEGTTRFATIYENGGRKDSAALLLRKLELKTRLFAHRLSPLVDAPQFAALPNDARTRIARRIEDVLTGKSPLNDSPAISEAECRELLPIVRSLSNGPSDKPPR